MPCAPSEFSPRVCIIGAGLSGICAAINLRGKLGISSFTIFERNEDVGGTWLTNSYPGCQCDVQSHLYSFSFEPNPEWSTTFAAQPEILEYIKASVGKYDLYSHIRFQMEVKSLEWQENLMQWRVSFTNTKKPLMEQQALFDIVINAPGLLHTSNIPKQFLSFKGPIIHSAEWDSSVALDATTRVAVVGSGASAVQIIPSIANKVKELHAYQRQPAWIWPKFEREIPKFVQWIFANVPLAMWLFRCFLYFVGEVHFPAFQSNTWFNHIASLLGRLILRMQVYGNNEDKLVKNLSADYTFGCKRVLMSTNYYPTFTLPHVKLHRSLIAEVTSNSIRTENGEENKIDVLILATGFKATDYFSPLTIVGKNGENILETWKSKGPSLYCGLIGNSTPNLFHLLGPSTQLGHNSLIFQLECQVDLMIRILTEMKNVGAKQVTVKTEFVDEFMKERGENIKKTVFANGKCNSWYQDHNGSNHISWPSSTLFFWTKTRSVEFSQFEFVQAKLRCSQNNH